MPIADALLPEFDHEMATTRSLLERVPEARADWTPHKKSMTFGGLAAHIASLPVLVKRAVDDTELDFNPPGGKPYERPRLTTTAALLETFDRNVAEARAAIAGATDAELGTIFTLKSGGHAIVAAPRAMVVRTMVLNHIIHHRGQLSVYLRLNDIPLPSIYGPTADM